MYSFFHSLILARKGSSVRLHLRIWDSIDRFEAQRDSTAPVIVRALEEVGEDAINSYGSTILTHNTLSTLAGLILDQGLMADGTLGSPKVEDVDFARQLFIDKGDSSKPEKVKLFDNYISGRKNDRAPGVFFSASADVGSIPELYGVPERMERLAVEMGSVAEHGSGLYTYAERTEAARIHDYYKDVILNDGNSHIVIFMANPFSPSIINSRLRKFSEMDLKSYNSEQICGALEMLDRFERGGVHVSGSVPPEDLSLLDGEIPLKSTLQEASSPLLENSMFY